MKVTVPTAKLLEAVGHAASVAASKSPKPVLECVGIHADPKTGLSLESTDLDVGIRLHVPGAEVAEGGVLAVSAARLHAIVREVEDEATTFRSEDENLVVETGGNLFRVRGENPDDLSEVPFFPDVGAVQVPGALLRDMIRRTVFATAKEAGRYALHGVLFRISGGLLELVATDGRRLALARREIDGGAGRDLKVIVGPKGLSLLERVLGDDPGTVAIQLQERQVLFRAGDALVVSRLIDGTFPAYEDVVPKSTEHGFTLSVSDFAAALRRASLLATRDAISVQFDLEPQQLTIRSRAPEVGEARVTVPVDYEGPPDRLGFNPTFLSDALKVMAPDDAVRFAFNNGKAPGKLTDRPDYVYVVMPIALE